MRDQHWERHHQEEKPIDWSQKDLDEDELQPLLFDVVKGDKVEMAIDLLPQLPKIKDFEAIRKELLFLAAGCASMAMIHLIQPNIESWYSLSEFKRWDGTREGYLKQSVKALTAAIEGNNVEVFRHLLLACNGKTRYSCVLPEILKSRNEEFRTDWEVCIQAEFEHWSLKRASNPRRSSVPFCQRFTDQRVVRAIAGDPSNELFLLSIWEKLNLPKNMRKIYLGDALVNIAVTCSVKLAKYLVHAGADVCHRRSVIYLTPLHHAATHNTRKAAELMKSLLCSGAEPTTFASSKRQGGTSKLRDIMDEVGMQGISKWLDVSWEDLVRETQTERSVKDAEKAGAGDTSCAP